MKIGVTIDEVRQQGTQTAYVPSRLHGHNLDLQHPDVEFGFVTSVKSIGAFCRFWSKFVPDELRTTANSEMAPFHSLALHEGHSEEAVAKQLKKIMGG